VQTGETKHPKSAEAQPGSPPGGAPFDDLFEEFFKRRQQQGKACPKCAPQIQLAGLGFVIDASGIS